MEGRPRLMMTLSDQLAVPDSPDLRDLLKAHNSRRRRRRRGRGETHTLASAIAAEKRDSAAGEGGGGRTLLEILLRGDEGAGSGERRGRQRPRVDPDPAAGGDADADAAQSPSITTLETILSTPEPPAAAIPPPAEEAVAEEDAGSREEEEEGEHTERVSLMALLEQTEWHGSEEPDLAVTLAAAEEEEEEEIVADVWRCCVCMVRRKGAAFIPCGHTFCRACSRTLLARRGSCPLCNAAIEDVLDIY